MRTVSDEIMLTYSVRVFCSESDSPTELGDRWPKSRGITIHEVRALLKEMRRFGYSADRRRSPSGDHHGDPAILVERCE